MLQLCFASLCFNLHDNKERKKQVQNYEKITKDGYTSDALS